ncbi:MAG TPA: DUF4038 domain-containing protein [Verrucomicrobiae bacterium]|nr:DUF4038 domain-containing protein [Verrucomicrobiae bacterium]
MNLQNGSAALFMKGLLWLFASVLLAEPVGANPAYPLKAVAGRHYLVDQNGAPFFIQGASPWYLSQLLTNSAADFYLSNRWSQGYNSVVLDLAPEGSPEDDFVPTNLYGQFPFTNITETGYTNLLSWNTSYFTNDDWVLNDAARYGICCFCYPMYDGYGGAAWYTQMVGNTSNALYAYGQFIGNRYKRFPNIVWVGAGDYNESDSPQGNLWNWIADGILSVDTNHLFAAQPKRGAQAFLEYSNFVDVEATYPFFDAYDNALADYQLNPVVPSFDREPYYEYDPTYNSSALNCRQYAYWSVFYGDTSGQFYGNAHEWLFTTGWQTQIVDSAATTLPFLGKLMNSRPWYHLVPDFNYSAVIGGYGTYGTIDFATAVREASGKTVMAYIPQDAMTLTVDMTSISGKSANAWWYNPRNGSANLIGIYSNTGTQTFTAPDTNDWVLVLDDASQNYPPPGVTDPDAPTIYVDLTNETAVVGSSATLGVVASGAAPLSFQWFFEGNILPGAVSNPLTLTNITTANAGNYQVIATNSVGAAASYVATLTVLTPNVMSIANMSSDLFQVTLTGIPGQTYMLQYTTNLSSPWQSLGNATINSSGAFRFYQGATSVNGFFRAAYPLR